ncbi:AraC family transcriptional regulator [Microcoleus sp. FACHB-1515]|uniref:AraC family transcriptional regulator n=1 Tax=Cyanophyceae TaxID=3028117 RepID=UPI0016843E92|nr:AraC family transcriptional regulator [Microcoleus sp. FACHB-1515]MBD2090095.1 AraC family transcriptional regulator [Microcoleus sp. FACHB-1515]
MVQEQVKFWRFAYREIDRSPSNIDLLHAHFITHSFDRHIHDTYAIGVIQSGAEAFTYRGEYHVAPAGSIAVINPGEVHTGHAVDGSGWTYRMLYPDVSLLEQTAIELGKRNLPYFPVAVLEDRLLAEQILKLHRSLEGENQLEQDSRLLWTMAQLITRYAGDRPAVPGVRSAGRSIQLVRDYLDAHYAESISLEQLSRIANLSPFYLIRAFRKQVGLPPHGYQNQVRLHQARRLLAQGESAAIVAQTTGFADQSHLHRLFKRMLGVTPGQYRQGNFVQDP